MSNLQKVIDYYNQNHFVYQLFWYNQKNLAMHFGLWDSNTKNRSEALINTNIVMSKIAKVKEGELVLDAGCGVGGSSIWLAKNLGTRNVGISVVKKHVEKAKEYAIKHEVADRTKFLVMDFTKTRFKQMTFDVVWVIESVCHAENKLAFVEEASRILKSGGRIIVCDYWLTRKKYPEEKEKMIRQFCEGWALPGLENKNNFEKLLKQKGFKSIKFFDKTKNVIPSARILHNWAKYSYPLVKFLNIIGVFSEVVVKNVTSAILPYKLINLVEGKYGIFYAVKD